MRIEKINDNQIRCYLSKEEMESRQLRLRELAYGTAKAKRLFHDLLREAYARFGFEADNMPVMIEAVPLHDDSLVLIVTRVDNPEELDTRFSSFAPQVRSGSEGTEETDHSPLGQLLEAIRREMGDAPSGAEETDTSGAGGSPKGSSRRLSFGQDPSGKMPSGAAPSGITPSEIKPSETDPSENTPSENTPSEKAPSQKTPSENTPSEKPPSQKDPAGEETAAKEAAGDSRPARKDPEKAPAGKLPRGKERSAPDSGRKAGPVPAAGKMPGLSASGQTQLFTFSSLGRAADAACMAAPDYSGASSLYRDAAEKKYYLFLTPATDMDKVTFTRTLSVFSEFGSAEYITPAREQHLREHCDVICASDAVSRLARLQE